MIPTVPSTMRAAVHDRYGEPEVIRVGQVPVPSIADDEVLLRVSAAGVDRGTWHLLTGQPYLARLAIGLRRPRVPVLGRDVAGEIVARGSAARQFNVGDSVFGVATGSFAEYAKAKERKLARTPDGLSAVEAAVLGISGMTALQAIDAAQVRGGSSVLVIGASGGVGSYAVQIAHGVGAHVTGISRAAKADFVRSLGAERVIAYDRDGNDQQRRPLRRHRRHRRRHGHLRASLHAGAARDARDRGRRSWRPCDRDGPTAARADPVAVPPPATHVHHQPRTPSRPRTAAWPRRRRCRQADPRHRLSTRANG